MSRVETDEGSRGRQRVSESRKAAIRRLTLRGLENGSSRDGRT